MKGLVIVASTMLLVAGHVHNEEGGHKCIHDTLDHQLYVEGDHKSRLEYTDHPFENANDHQGRRLAATWAKIRITPVFQLTTSATDVSLMKIISCALGEERRGEDVHFLTKTLFLFGHLGMLDIYPNKAGTSGG